MQERGRTPQDTPLYSRMVGLDGKAVQFEAQLKGGSLPASESSAPQSPDLVRQLRGEVLTRIQKVASEVRRGIPSPEDISYPETSVKPGYAAVTDWLLDKCGLRMPGDLSVILVESGGRKGTDKINFLATRGQDSDKPALRFDWIDDTGTKSLTLIYEEGKSPAIFRCVGGGKVLLGGSNILVHDNVLLLARVTNNNLSSWEAYWAMLPGGWKSVFRDHKLIAEPVEQVKAGGVVAPKKESVPTPDQRLAGEVFDEIKRKAERLSWREPGKLAQQDISFHRVSLDVPSIFETAEILRKMGITPAADLFVIIVGDKDSGTKRNNLVILGEEHAFPYTTHAPDLLLKLHLKSLFPDRDIRDVTLKYWRVGNQGYFICLGSNEIYLGHNADRSREGVLFIDGKNPLDHISSVSFKSGWREAFDGDGKLMVGAAEQVKIAGAEKAVQSAKSKSSPVTAPKKQTFQDLLITDPEKAHREMQEAARRARNREHREEEIRRGRGRHNSGANNAAGVEIALNKIAAERESAASSNTPHSRQESSGKKEKNRRK